MSASIAIVGAGAWGTALAAHLCRRDGLAVTLCARDAAQAARDRRARATTNATCPASRCPTSLDGHVDARGSRATRDARARRDAGRRAARRCARARGRGRARAARLAVERVRRRARQRRASGGRGARAPASRAALARAGRRRLGAELRRGGRARIADGARRRGDRRRRSPRSVAALLRGDTLRAYESDDIAGVEVGGAVKNVLAIAAGASDGLGFGHNARAALDHARTRGDRTPVAPRLGGRRETLMGLAGLGDLVLTCTGDLSRNRRVGLALARGQPLAGDPRRARPCRRRRAARRARCARSPRITASRCRSATRSTACCYEGSLRATRSCVAPARAARRGAASVASLARRERPSGLRRRLRTRSAATLRRRRPPRRSTG